ncbi:MAG TPA: SRPBCC domain-containing protein [Cyclobacteriaceae bacterium]|nr:SRPBCC domain-containing protein [Cyclobacteriaceae bacterium]
MEKVANDVAERELRIERMLNAPIELVWEVWTDPEHIKNWWGPNGFTNTIHKMEVAEGSEWLLTMHGPDGKNYANRSIFKEVVRHRKIVYEHFNPNFIATVEFESQQDKTFMKWQMLFDTRELYETVVKTFGADKGMRENVLKLEIYLTQKMK